MSSRDGSGVVSSWEHSPPNPAQLGAVKEPHAPWKREIMGKGSKYQPRKAL